MIMAMIIKAVKGPPTKAPQSTPFRFFLLANLENMNDNNAPINSGMRSCIFLVPFVYFKGSELVKCAQ